MEVGGESSFKFLAAREWLGELDEMRGKRKNSENSGINGQPRGTDHCMGRHVGVLMGFFFNVFLVL